MKQIALFPGTFDPYTNGHLDIVNKGLAIFEEIVIAIGMNAGKKDMFSIELRKKWIESVYRGNDAVRVISYSGLTIKVCKEVNAGFILRGLRTVADFEYERQIALVNESMSPGIHSVFIMSGQENSIVSSTIIRDLIRHGGDYMRYLPEGVKVEEALL
jgi:pantetheine-phosphate adenylyltransferase